MKLKAGKRSWMLVNTFPLLSPSLNNISLQYPAEPNRFWEVSLGLPILF